MNWAEVAARGYAVPEGLHPPDALGELLGMLGSEDPEVRDRQAYSTLAHWTRAGHFDSVLRELGDATAFGLSHESVLVRSFSALVLGEAIRRDRLTSLLPGETVAVWRDRWTRWYPHELDVRSFEEGVGWVHAVAHGADTAREVASHPRTERAELRGLLDTLTKRLRSLPLHLNQTEDDRLALAMLAVLAREEYEPGDVRGWLADYRTLWTPLSFPLSPGAALALRTLHSLHTLLHLGATVDGVTLRPAYPEATLAAVQDILRSVHPYSGEGQTV
ncbi:hypothetical protein DAETH_24330 [Deinococcus aetherius]|uniref:DUF2785 domain-containing protein n=1 Tax=Deinococcus aetherius TaxID=200252 RepID=A0ABN6RKS5_9DEIO|nr:DUF2785 domain-containing protein [Deinococcus aetherius]BDP42464.1 hypothetical protein DAETH_24330 [Deinococcus aetherius]